MLRSKGNTTFVRLALAVLALPLMYCGGSKGGLTTPTQTAQGPKTFPARSFSSLAPERAVFGDYTVDVAGTLQISADWTFSSDDIDVFVTSTSCSTSSYDDLLGGSGACTTLAEGIDVGEKPERATFNAAVGTYRVWVASSFLSSSNESGTLSVTLTPR
jgi:hypothetical protein